jgi:D-alanyl-D-alanine carboxypeptidase (penicillin-binding protein 5/6)
MKLTWWRRKNVGGIKKKGEEVNLTTEISVSEYAAAPIIKGTKLGEVAVLKNGRELERVDLIAAADVARAGLGRQIKKIIDQVLLAVK